MYKKITFKEPFESKLKKLRIKTKFVRNAKKYWKCSNERLVEILNDTIDWEESEQWALFIFSHCEINCSPEGSEYWINISQL